MRDRWYGTIQTHPSQLREQTESQHVDSFGAYVVKIYAARCSNTEDDHQDEGVGKEKATGNYRITKIPNNWKENAVHMVYVLLLPR
eukprot:g41576.t1